MIKKYKKRISKKAGLPPGSLVHVGQKFSENEELELITYKENSIEAFRYKEVNKDFNKFHPDQVKWLNLEGLHNTRLLEEIGTQFGLHPLLLEDVLNTAHRPSAEGFDGYVFFSLKMPYKIDKTGIEYEQISLVLGPDYVISFQEKPGDIFTPIRDRLKDEKSRMRRLGADYLFYRLIDTVVDSYYLVLETIGERIEVLEEEVFASPDRQTLKSIQELKKELIYLRKSVYPLREAISKVTKDPGEIIHQETDTYFQDVYEHTIHVIETVETYRDLTSGLMDMYMTAISNRMNEVMKVLTIMATIFIPLTFVAGIYGMNFQYMPELSWKWGYPTVWGVMLVMVVSMILYFKKKDWL